MFKRLALVAGLLFAVAVVTGPLATSVFADHYVAAANACDKCKHDKCPGDCSKCPDCAKKGH